MELDFSKVIVTDFSYVLCDHKMRPGYYNLMHKRRWADGFIYVKRGSAHYTFADKSFDVKAHDIFFLPNESSYDIEVGEAYLVDYFDCTLDYLDGKQPQSCCFSLESSEEVDRLMNRLEHCWKDNTPTGRMQAIAALYSLFSILSQSRGNGYMGADNRIKIIRAGKMIEERCNNQNFSCAGLAAELSMSEVHFRRLFSRYYGMTPNQFLTDIRMRMARNLLIQNEHSICEIADLTGYQSVFYFCRAFKRETGHTPTEFRKNVF